jgi:ribosomal RNA assembly protein
MYLRMPKERIGVAIGPEGVVKREIEMRARVKIVFDSETGEVQIQPGDDPLGVLKANDVLKAIARGFSPERAFRLFHDDQFLDMIEIEDYVGDSERAVSRIKGRLIGEEGKTRRAVEQTTGTCISIYGKTVAVIGTAEQLKVTRLALEMLLAGAEHSTVYKFLERKRKDVKSALRPR